MQGQAGQGPQQGIQVPILKAQNRHQCQAAGQEHGIGDDVQEGIVWGKLHVTIKPVSCTTTGEGPRPLQRPHTSATQACSLTSQKELSTSQSAPRGLEGVDWVRRTGLRRKLLGLTGRRRALLSEREEIFLVLCRACTTLPG